MLAEIKCIIFGKRKKLILRLLENINLNFFCLLKYLICDYEGDGVHYFWSIYKYNIRLLKQFDGR